MIYIVNSSFAFYILQDLSGMEGRKRKDSIKESALVEPLEKIVKVEDELKAL